jgi:hypothetical protein
MKVLKNTERELEILVELPRFIVWFMLGPIGGFGALFTVALLLGGEFLQGLVTGVIIATLVLVGRYFLTQSTRVWLNGNDGKVHILRTSLIDSRQYDFPLEHLDSAEVSQDRSPRSRSGSGRATSSLHLVFSNTRPATRVPLTGWSVSGGGAGMLADTINDWLRAWRDHVPELAHAPGAPIFSATSADSQSATPIEEPS